MKKMMTTCILVVYAAADRCGDASCGANVVHGRSLLQKVDAVREVAAESDDDDKKKKGLITSLELDVKVMEGDVAEMLETMSAVESTMGLNSKTSGTSNVTSEEKKEQISLQQIAIAPNASLKARMNLLERNVADLLSRTSAMETEVGVARPSMLDITKDPVIGIANRAVELHVQVHDLQGRVAKTAHIVLESLKPDAMLLTKRVEVLEDKVNTLKSSVQGPPLEDEVNHSESSELGAAPSLLGFSSSGEGLKTQVYDLETRMVNMLSTAAMLETEVNGDVRELANEEEINRGVVPGAMGMADRVKSLHVNVHDLEGWVAKLEHGVLQGLEPDAALLSKDVGVLEAKMNTLQLRLQGHSVSTSESSEQKSGEQDPAPSLLGIGSSKEGLKSQVLDLERRVGELSGTAATLETEVEGLPNKLGSAAALLQRGNSYENHGLVPRVSVLKDVVANLKSRVFALEQQVTGL